jgi:protein TonB
MTAFSPDLKPVPAPAPPNPVITASQVLHKAIPASSATRGTRSATAVPSSAVVREAAAQLSNTPARPSYSPKPPYPPEARRLHQEGKVLLQVTIGADGHATSVSVIRSSGVAALDESAVATVRRWTFTPARVAGVAVASKVEIPISFSLAP